VSGVCRLLVICPSWVGDAAMATPALSLLREHMPGAFIGALVRPGIDEVYDGSPFFDEMHVDRAAGMMGPKFAANKIRPRQYEAALLLSNSLRTAVTARLAGIPRRVGFDRDGRGLLLSQRLQAPRNARAWAVIPAITYYWHAATRLLQPELPAALDASAPLPDRPMRLGVSDAQEAEARAGLARLLSPHGPQREGPSSTTREAVIFLCPGGNDPAKRWPREHFADLAARLARHASASIIVTGSPAEADLTRSIVDGARTQGAPENRVFDLAALGVSLGGIKAALAGASLLITNDTGPRHLGAAMGVPLVSLFGPTDRRWARIVSSAPEVEVLADPTLPPELCANDHPERCAMTRIEPDRVWEAACGVLRQHPVQTWEDHWASRSALRIGASGGDTLGS
jgi:heptosyltransferase-2